MTSETSSFLTRLMAGLLADAHDFIPGNHDDERYPTTAAERRKRAWREKVLSIAARFGWRRRNYNLNTAAERFAKLLSHADGFAHTFTQLHDEASRELMLSLFRYHILGSSHTALPLQNADYWHLRTEGVSRCHRGLSTHKSANWPLNEFEFAGKRGPLRLALHDFGFATTFLVEHYALRRAGVNIAAEPGNVVIDGGGCWGDTALYFADCVGERGRVASFEFDTDNLTLLRANLAKNPHLQPQIDLVEHALWEISDEKLAYSPSGPATALGQSGTREVITLSIDDLVERHGYERVDFIKMDIEGAEGAALRGAEKTIRRWKPKLAISAYHKVDDLAALPAWIAGLRLGYRLHIHHVTTHKEETLVFADTR